jgi:glucose/mannose-6-phosphate isomerase
MVNLDDLGIIEKLDGSDMRKLLLGFPRQYQQAHSLAEDFTLPKGWDRRVRSIVISGMGGSAIGGDLLRSLFSPACPVPIVINRNYSVPGFVGEDTFFIAASFSGNTEETLAAFEAAVERRAKVASISGGGQLEKLSRQADVPHFSVPERGIQPRCAFGYLFIPMVVFLSKLGFIPDQTPDIENAVELLSDSAQRLSPDVPTRDNQAKQIAQAVFDKLPVIYAPEDYFDVVAMRWKGQFNENSKMMAFYNVVPEMNHNEIVGWGVPEDITRRCIVVMLKGDADYEKIRKRMDITESLITSAGAQSITVQAKGSSSLAKSLYLIYLGDFASYYLAILNDVDPTPIDRISLLKSKLAQ